MAAVPLVPAAALALLSAGVRRSRAQTESTPPHTFAWGTSADDANNRIPVCGDVQFTRYETTSPPPVDPAPPFFAVIYPENGTPEIVPAGESGNFNWTNNYPSGSRLLLGMVDSNGNAGGVGSPYSVTGSGSSSCGSPPSALGEASISVAAGAQAPQCAPIDITWSGGQAPFTLTVVRPGSIPYNVTGIEGSPFTWTNSIQNGGQALLAVSDATGGYFRTNQIWMSGVSQDSACLAGAGNGSGVPDGGSDSKDDSSSGVAIGAGVGGAILVIGAAALGLWWWMRKKRQNQAGGAQPYTGGEKPGFIGGAGGHPGYRQSSAHSDEAAHLAAPHSSAHYGTSPSSTSENFHASSEGMPPHSAYSAYSAGQHAASPRSNHFPGSQSNRVSLASSGHGYGHGPHNSIGSSVAGYPPVPVVPQPPPTGFRIANPDNNGEGSSSAGGAAGPSAGTRRASLGPGSAYNQDYGSKAQPQGDLPGARKYFQAKDVAEAEPDFDSELPPSYVDRRRAE